MSPTATRCPAHRRGDCYVGSGAATVASLGHAHPRPGRASPQRTSLRGWAFTFLLFFLFFPRDMCPPSKTQSGLLPSAHATGWTWPPRRTPAAGTVPQCPSGCCRPPVSTVTPAACVDSRRLTAWSTPVRTPSGGEQGGRRAAEAARHPRLPPRVSPALFLLPVPGKGRVDSATRMRVYPARFPHGDGTRPAGRPARTTGASVWPSPRSSCWISLPRPVLLILKGNSEPLSWALSSGSEPPSPDTPACSVTAGGPPTAGDGPTPSENKTDERPPP